MRPHAHVGDDLAGRDILPFVHQEFSIVRIGGQQTVAMLDDDEVSIAAQSAAGVDDPARARGTHVLTEPAQQ